MLAKITHHIPLTTIIISYFFICGGLHLIGFWSTFDIDISNLISIADIPKSFIYPFLVSQGFFLFNAIINLMTMNPEGDIENEEPKKIARISKWKMVLRVLISLDMIILYIFITAANLHSIYKLDSAYWIISAIVLSFLLSEKMDRITMVKKAIPYYYIRAYLLNTLISIPLFSLAIGKASSLAIYHNKDNKRVILSKDINPDVSMDSSTYKLLGFIGDKVIVASRDNKKIVFVNQASVDKVQVEKLK